VLLGFGDASRDHVASCILARDVGERFGLDSWVLLWRIVSLVSPVHRRTLACGGPHVFHPVLARLQGFSVCTETSAKTLATVCRLTLARQVSLPEVNGSVFALLAT
jgi:hypothetical protein